MHDKFATANFIIFNHKNMLAHRISVAHRAFYCSAIISRVCTFFIIIAPVAHIYIKNTYDTYRKYYVNFTHLK